MPDLRLRPAYPVPGTDIFASEHEKPGNSGAMKESVRAAKSY